MEPGWILTKNSVIKKVVGLFAGLSEDYRDALEGPAAGFAAPAAAAAAATPDTAAAALPFGSPKISKGENYQGLPYVMLDYPRLFGREDVLAIRTFFWWGHSFSVTVHLKGAYRDRYLPVLQQRWAELAAAGFHVGISEDEWRHEHVPETYRAIVSAEDIARPAGAAPDGLSQEPASPDGLSGGPAAPVASFLKLSAACGLDRWEEAHEVLLGLFRVLVDVLH
ncbi:MAG TPA: hypothetical protein VGN00_29690 [Puia sp.]